MPTPVIRPAQPQDLDFLTWVMRTAAISHLPHCVWDVLLGIPADQVDSLLQSVCGSDDPHWCHLKRFWVAEVDGEPAAAMTGFDTATAGTPVLEREILARVAELALPEDAVAAVLRRAVALGRATPPNIENGWGVENVAVAPGHRGTGVIDVLLEHVLAVGRESGYRDAQVLCLNGNVRAERTWMRHGFELTTDYRDRSFEQTFGTAGLRLYARTLLS
ncbi:GNAT family N-acetyltransferase [Mycobacterium sp. MBM]|nr:GNAT family N-acetyltransferase [Mycobacterium sp. MBM]